MTKSSLSVLIRTAKPSDAGAIIEINKSILKERIYMLRDPDEADYEIHKTENEILYHISGEGCLYIISEAEDKPMGYLEFSNGIFRKTRHAGMMQIFITKEYREDGIGFEFMKTLIDWAQKNPVIEKITLNVFSTNDRAVNLYRKAGFLEEGRCFRDMKFENGNYADSILMYKFVK